MNSLYGDICFIAGAGTKLIMLLRCTWIISMNPSNTLLLQICMGGNWEVEHISEHMAESLALRDHRLSTLPRS